MHLLLLGKYKTFKLAETIVGGHINVKEENTFTIKILD